jgi:hypothetical protein
MKCLIGFTGPGNFRSSGRGIFGHCMRRARYRAMPGGLLLAVIAEGRMNPYTLYDERLTCAEEIVLELAFIWRVFIRFLLRLDKSS